VYNVCIAGCLIVSERNIQKYRRNRSKRTYKIGGKILRVWESIKEISHANQQKRNDFFLLLSTPANATIRHRQSVKLYFNNGLCSYNSPPLYTKWCQGLGTNTHPFIVFYNQCSNIIDKNLQFHLIDKQPFRQVEHDRVVGGHHWSM